MLKGKHQEKNLTEFYKYLSSHQNTPIKLCLCADSTEGTDVMEHRQTTERKKETRSRLLSKMNKVDTQPQRSGQKD